MQKSSTAIEMRKMIISIGSFSFLSGAWSKGAASDPAGVPASLRKYRRQQFPFAPPAELGHLLTQVYYITSDVIPQEENEKILNFGEYEQTGPL